MSSVRNLPALRTAAETAFAACDELELAISDAVAEVRPEGAEDWLAAASRPELDRARALLRRDGYSVCFAGGFSAGKSTLINALAEDPDLLPTAAGECTLSVTICTGPLADGRECVRAAYLSREAALRGLFLHQARYRPALARFAQAASSAGADELLGMLRRTITQLPTMHRDLGLPEHQRRALEPAKAAQLAGELAEFVELLDVYRDRLGSIHDDALSNAPTYLTYDRQGRGIGHMLLLDTVTLHKRNKLFQNERVRIIDLPGLDSTNAYARQVTLGYLKQADVVVNVLPPQGFTMSYLDIINEVDEANRGNIANKMFYVINRFDANEERDFSKERLEALLRDQIAGELRLHGFDPGRLHATVALLDVQRLRGDELAHASLLAACRAKAARVSDDVEDPWRTIARNALGGHSVELLRESLLKHLREQVESERFEDIRRALDRPTTAAAALLGRNRKEVDAALGMAHGRIQGAREFTDRLMRLLALRVGEVCDRLPAQAVANVRGRMVVELRRMVELFRRIPLADPAGGQLRFTGSQARLQQPLHIRQHWLDWSRQHYSDRFVELVRTLASVPASEALDAALRDARLSEILTALEPRSGPLRAAVDEAIARARYALDLVVALRAEEEVRLLRGTSVQANGTFEPTWTPAVEQRFKDQMVDSLGRSLSAYAERLSEVIALHQAGVMRALLTDLRAQSSAIEAAAAQVPGQAPDHLLGEDSDGAAALRRAHLVRWHQLNEIGQAAVFRFATMVNGAARAHS